MKLCQSFPIFCNSSPQVVELSLFLFQETNPIIEEILADLGLMVTGSDNNGASAAK